MVDRKDNARPVVYLAGPIDQAHGSHAVNEMRYNARMELAARRATFYDPHGAWVVAQFDDERPLPATIQRVNDTALMAADGMMALLPAGVPTVGVPFEIALAIQHDIPVVVVCDRPPAALLASPARFAKDTSEAADQLLYEISSQEATSGYRSLLFQRTQSDAQNPTRAYTGDAGYDLYTLQHIEVPPLSLVDVPSGIAVAIPVGHYGRIVGRSSTHRKRGLSVVEGVIDAGYRGPLFSCVWNPSPDKSVHIAKGERVAQLIVTPISQLDAYEVDALPNSDRGARGFGSSGRSNLVVR